MLPWLLKDGLPDEKRCHAKSRRSGWKRCGLPSAHGKRVCRVHGSRRSYPSGKDHPNFKHGLRTKEAEERSKQMWQDLRFYADLIKRHNL
jgi:predicted SAM-dependent methyltransferase